MGVDGGIYGLTDKYSVEDLAGLVGKDFRLAAALVARENRNISLPLKSRTLLSYQWTRVFEAFAWICGL